MIQKSDETFTEYLSRFRSLAAKLWDRPSERDQVQMMMRGLNKTYKTFIFGQAILTFEGLLVVGQQVEDAINHGDVLPTKAERSEFGLNRKSYPSRGSGSNPPAASKQVAATSSAPLIVETTAPSYTTQRPGPRRQFTDLGMTKTSLLDKLVKGGKLKILETRPVPNPLPHYWRLNEFCKYHNQSGHDTEYCTALRHAIQDLLDSGKFKLQPRQASVANNPLPHLAVNFIDWGEVYSDKDIPTEIVQFVNGGSPTPGDAVSLVSIEEVGGEYEVYFPEIPQ